MAAIITRLISFEKIWLRVVSAMTGNPPLEVFLVPLNVQDNARVGIVNIISIFVCLCLMHADVTITLSLTFKGKFGIGQLRFFCEFSFSRFVSEVWALRRDTVVAFPVCGLVLSHSGLRTGGRDWFLFWR